MKQILPAYGLPEETVAAKMMHNKNTKVMIRSPNENTDFFDIVTGDKLASYVFIICQDYEFRRSMDLIKVNSYMLKKRNTDDIQQKLTDVIMLTI